ncbi:hypothetical protein LINGRAHAP2_LOCUS25920, partial [Linum grandiflorum]
IWIGGRVKAKRVKRRWYIVPVTILKGKDHIIQKSNVARWSGQATYMVQATWIQNPVRSQGCNFENTVTPKPETSYE